MKTTNSQFGKQLYNMDNVIPIYNDIPVALKPLLDKYGLRLSGIKAKIKRGNKVEFTIEAVEVAVKKYKISGH